jgi:alpha-tubulin suppressor-like RCC1 family protein
MRAIRRARSAALLALLLALLAPAPARAGTARLAQAEPGTADWTLVSAGGGHTCGIRTTGRLYCWGDDSFGQLGDNFALAAQSTPVEVAGGITDWVSVSANVRNTCARTATRRLDCWGSDSNGQLGDDAAIGAHPMPVEVAGGATDWGTVDVGGAHVCARKTNGRLYCWGSDSHGQLGNSAAIADRHVPTEVAGAATNWGAVAAGTDHTCARKTNGRLFCWGNDANGRLGNNAAIADRHVPTEVFGGATNWSSVTAGGLHTCARKSNGRLFCWGSDFNGQLGDNGTIAERHTPSQVAGAATNWASVSALAYTTCARRTNGHVWCWGNDGNGQLGNGLPRMSIATPVEVSGAASNWASVSAGAFHTCARKTTNRIFCWGLDSEGQLGNGLPLADRPSPVEVSP